MHAIFDDIIFVHFNTWCEKKVEREEEKKKKRERERGEREGGGKEREKEREREIRNCYGSMIKYEMRTS